MCIYRFIYIYIYIYILHGEFIPFERRHCQRRCCDHDCDELELGGAK